MKSKLDDLKTTTKALVTRVVEVDLRPKKLQELKDTLNMTENFLQVTRSLFQKKDDLEKPFTEVEINYLEKTIKDTYVRALRIVPASLRFTRVPL